jgi:hypothetical protein
MSMYGPPGGPYPDQPQDPWQSGQPQDPYGQPADPYGGGGGYGQPEPWGGAQASVPPGSPSAPGGYGPPPYGQPAYGQPAYGGQQYDPTQMAPLGPPYAPAPPQRRGPSGLVIGIIAMVVVLLCGGGALGAYLLTRDGGDPGTNVATDATTSPSPSAAEPTTARPTTAAPTRTTSEPSEDARTAKVGDCYVNRGSNDKPDMRKVTCASGTYQVLRRIDGTVDRNQCDGVPGYTDFYFYDHPTNSLDFVLCLRKR